MLQGALMCLVSAATSGLVTYCALHLHKTSSVAPLSIRTNRTPPPSITPKMARDAVEPMARQAAPQVLHSTDPWMHEWPEPDLYRWTPTCETSACQAQSRWLLSMMRNQVDPCWETNAFVCTRSALPSVQLARVMQAGHKDGDHGASGHSRANHGVDRDKRAHRHRRRSDVDLHAACHSYVSRPEEGVDTVRQFAAQFNLDLGSMKDDLNEDPLDRVLNLSLHFGVHCILRAQRDFDIADEPSWPSVLRVVVAQEISSEDWVTNVRDEENPSEYTPEVQIECEIMFAVHSDEVEEGLVEDGSLVTQELLEPPQQLS
ncbi:uncharacterized protein LOC144124012 [Amblyomma americanum]